MLSSFFTKGQELKYLVSGKTTMSDIIAIFYPKDLGSSMDIDTTQWRVSLIRERRNFKQFTDVEKNRFQKELEDCSEEDLQILKTIGILYYIDKDFQVITFTVSIHIKYLDKMPKLEKKIYEYARKHDDMSYLKPYVIVSDDFRGGLMKLRIMGWVKKPNAWTMENN